MIGLGASNDPNPVLPPELLARLVDLRPVLEVQGIVQLHGGRDRREAFRLRFRIEDPERGCRVHRSLPLGDDATAHAVQRLLEGWRQEKARRDQNKELADRIAAAHDRAQRGLVRRVTDILHRAGVSPEVQYEARQAVLEALQNGRMVVLHATAACKFVGENMSR